MQCQSSILPVQLFKMNVSNQSAAVSFKVLLSRFDLPIYTAIPLSEQAFRISNITIGFLLNIIILLVIVVSRQLHNPRHIFWVGVSLINQFYLMQCALEIVAIVYPNATICPLFVLNAGVGYSALLLCLSLAACDRYAAIAFWEWYKKRITNKVIVLVLIIPSFLLSLSSRAHFGQDSNLLAPAQSISLTCTLFLAGIFYWVYSPLSCTLKSISCRD